MDQSGSTDIALRVTNAYKSFNNKTKIINGLNMTVPQGCIYGLLGPSGCGKTTLLNSIMGTQVLDFGVIDIRVKSKKDIGYMPQALCLDKHLTVDESLMYYGTLYNMSGENIALRSTELCSAFDIDFQKSFIKNLSGGQCRRVSLAISLLHNPKIIVLDEPTVGIDLIISFNIWKYFVSLVKNHDKTIIITTHYIQEAIQADMIGLMRNGRILKETSPQSLLIQQETNSLETAFLKLCQSKEEILVEEVPDISHETSKGPNWFQDNNSDSYLTPHRIRALLKRNYSVISRDFLYTFFMIILPTIQIVISNFSMGNRIEHVNIVISNDEIDISRCSDANFEGCLFNDSYSGTLSCEMFNYLKYLNYDFVEVNNKDDGFNTVNLGEAIAFVHFPHNYTKGLRQHVIRNASYVYESESLVYLHSQNYVFKSQIFYDLHNVLNHVLDNAMTRCSANKKTVKIPMDIKREFGINVESLRDTLIGFIIVICSFYFASVCSASFMLMEKQDGLLSRTRLSGVTILEVIIALVVIQSFVYIFQMSIMIFVTYYIFPNTIEKLSNIYLMSVVFIFTFWVGFLYGVIVAGISRNSTEVMFLTFGYGLSAVMVGGSLWPVESQYSLIQQISYNLPISVAARLINNFVHKTLSIIHPVMLIDYAKLIGHVFVHSAGIYCLKFVNKNTWFLDK